MHSVEAIFSAWPEPVACYSETGRLVYANASARRIAGDAVSTALDPSDNKRAQAQRKDLVWPTPPNDAAFGASDVVDRTYECPSSGERFIARCVRTRGEDGAVSGYICSRRETTPEQAALAGQERMYREVLDTMPGFIFVKNLECEFVVANQRTAEIMRAPGPDSLLGKTDHDFYPKELADQYRADEEELFRRGETVVVEQSVWHADGSEGVMISMKRPLFDAEGTLCGYIGHGQDITELRRAEKDARDAHARLSALADNAPSCLFELTLDPQDRFCFRYLSARCADIFGLTEDAVISDATRLFSLIAPEDLEGVLSSLRVSQRNLGLWRHKFRVYHPTKGLRWIMGLSSAHRTDDQQAVLWSGSLLDVTEEVTRETALDEARRDAEAMRKEVEQQALRDALTNLPNRRALERMLRRIDEAGQGPVTMIRIDLDRFKYVNDTFGHEAGDFVLKHVAEVLVRESRTEDLAARIGGDEFSILLAPGAGVVAARKLGERIRDALSKPVYYNGQACRFGASVGIASTKSLEVGADELSGLADIALYRAKDLGRNRVEVFTPALYKSVVNERRLSFELQDALERREFVPYFQPQVDSATREVVGAEVLARWRHPRRGVLAPAEFMDLATRLRLIGELDRQIFSATLETLEQWQSFGFTPPKLSFNLSCERSRDPEISADAALLSRLKTRFGFELLETILLENTNEEFCANMQALRDNGVAIEIDDFGAGHASVVGLTTMQPDMLKIDRLLIAPLGGDPKATRLIAAIVDMAETLGISVTAEGVETEEQAEILRKLGVSTLQGFLFAPALPAEEFVAFAKGGVGSTAANAAS